MPFRSTKFIFALSLTLAGTAIAAYIVLWFLFVGEQRRAAVIVESLNEAERARASDASLQVLLSETALLRARADALFIGKEGTVVFLKELEQTGVSAGVKTTVVKVEKKEVEGREGSLASAGLETLIVAIEAGGSFAGVHRFLALAERLPRPITLSRVSFSRSEKGVWIGVFELEALKIK